MPGLARQTKGALRRSRRFVVWHVAVLALALPARAQLPVRFDAGAGPAFPTAPGIANQYWGAGYTLSAGMRWRATARWTTGVDLGFARFERDAGTAPLAPGGGTATPGSNALHVIPILFAGEFAWSEWSNTRPFLSAHAGYARVRTSSSSPRTTADPKSDAFAIGVGAGVRTLLNGSADLVVDAGWRIAFADPKRIAWVPVRIAVRF